MLPYNTRKLFCIGYYGLSVCRQYVCQECDIGLYRKMALSQYNAEKRGLTLHSEACIEKQNLNADKQSPASKA